MKCAARDQRPAFPLQCARRLIALMGEFKRARSAWSRVDARVKISSANMKATTKVALTRAISVVAKGRGDGQEFFRLKISGAGEQPRQAILSIDAYLTDPLGTIRALQLPLVSGVAQREFQARVQSALRRAVTFRVVTRPGWHGRLFVFPNGDVIGDQSFEVCLPSVANRYGRKFRERGTLEGWQKLPVLARGNTRLMLAIALAFVGPIGPLLRVERVMIQLVGDPGSGESAIVTGVGWVWGCNIASSDVFRDLEQHHQRARARRGGPPRDLSRARRDQKHRSRQWQALRCGRQSFDAAGRGFDEGQDD